ncbi:hypothetical protein AA0119_g4521 [Alternaria tenuissima]|jgi:hypothetical protein|uniref:Uncharacterized protein n=1 Tax=Alternaria tenuissima TaxID=119927 RepID=A0ABY0GEA2_9PLEO|nr:hypothetical protein AA0119_g4521 [Alternaria tenuissima]RYO16388.1 hypothetical protein AA0121_g6465 [Alternaria tenuissima]RYO58111.1 hypothetical protein AA0116_g8028 [Alternaria tenuissima]
MGGHADFVPNHNSNPKSVEKEKTNIMPITAREDQ